MSSSQASIKSFTSVTKKIPNTFTTGKGGREALPITIDSDSDLEDPDALFSKKDKKAIVKYTGKLQPEPDGGASLIEPSEDRTNHSSTRTTTKLYVPRTSQVGYFKEIEVTREEADRIISEQAAATGQRKTQAKVYRRSDISVLDLTGDD